MSKVYLTSLNNIMRKKLQSEIEATLAIIEAFDFSSFSNIGSDQFTINGVNVTTDGELVVFNKQFRIELVRDFNDSHDFFSNYDSMKFGSEYKPIYYEIALNIRIKDDKLRMIDLEWNDRGSKAKLMKVLVGDKKILIEDEWFDIMGFEEKVFQQSTVEKSVPFDIHFFYDMFTKLHLFQRGE
jgi:hypothetical protein